QKLMSELAERSMAIYEAAAAQALTRGIIIADTKFEWGIPESEKSPILIDEALTPDSSRFWPADQYSPGKSQPSFDKQFLREYLEGMVSHGQWNKQTPGPALPAEIVEKTVVKYIEARDRICGA